ncbi:retroviral-like aspartic protease family protein [Ideonella sp. 4Y16]|uniref:Retroviral-like aspartic protease family protein n=1 Tax=Ideonella alba TaxID=2824118 RepID=A0A940YEE7_9BURK|nr:retropepsin-like aspartic protease [Ideonella alba]MBQ0931661.1 retroviral-like aspartic protease family protein [Ideonella alba]MBQ0944095.1 retroviral-like aspartic protease family protein [Ideonella alba]
MNEFPRTLKLLTIWLLLGTLVFLGVQALLHERQRPRLTINGGQVTLQRGPDGHFHWPGTVDGREVVFLVDTGATTTALPGALAAQLGLRREGTLQSQTAGGTVMAWQARAEVGLAGGLRFSNLTVTVIDRMNGPPLLGMDVLKRLRLVQDGATLQASLP